MAERMGQRIQINTSTPTTAPGVVQQRLGTLAGGLIGLSLAAGMWGADALAMSQAHLPQYYLPVLAGALVVTALGALAGWLAARTARNIVGALLWLAVAVVSVVMAGHLAFEGRTLLAWLADPRFWGLPIYPFDSGAQWRLAVGAFFPALVLTALGLVHDYRLEGIRSSLNAQRLSPRAWLLLLLPLPVVFAAGLAADGQINTPLRQPILAVAQVLEGAAGYTGDLDVLSRQTDLNYSAARRVRAELTPRFRLAYGDIDLGDEQTVVLVADFDNGAWINCTVLVTRVSYCQDALPPYAQGLQLLLAGQPLSQCADCQMQAGADWQAWLADHARFTGATPQISRVAQSGSYVIMRAANPGSGYAVECLFHGNRSIELLRCAES
jgi:hypothetical protein